MRGVALFNLEKWVVVRLPISCGNDAKLALMQKAYVCRIDNFE